MGCERKLRNMDMEMGLQHIDFASFEVKVKKFGFRGRFDFKHIEEVQLHKGILKLEDLQNP
jgi:hypothetical protein